MMVGELVAVFVMSFAVGILYRIPRRLLLPAASVGVAAWAAMSVAIQVGWNLMQANFAGSVVIGLLAEVLARTSQNPAIIFIIPGFFPLVPGADAYHAMLYMVKGQYMQGVSTAMQAVLIGGAIAAGIFVSSTLYRLLVPACRGKSYVGQTGREMDVS